MFSLPQFPAKKWFELLKELHRRLPRDRREHLELQQAIFRENGAGDFDLRSAGARA